MPALDIPGHTYRRSSCLNMRMKAELWNDVACAAMIETAPTTAPSAKHKRKAAAQQMCLYSSAPCIPSFYPRVCCNGSLMMECVMCHA